MLGAHKLATYVVWRCRLSMLGAPASDMGAWPGGMSSRGPASKGDHMALKTSNQEGLHSVGRKPVACAVVVFHHRLSMHDRYYVLQVHLGPAQKPQDDALVLYSLVCF